MNKGVTAIVAIGLLVMVNGCHHRPTWQDRIITKENADCFEKVKHFTCEEFVKTSIRVKDAAIYVKERNPDNARFIEISNVLIDSTDNHLRKLTDLDECWDWATKEEPTP